MPRATCTIPECNRSVHSHNRCSPHVQQMKGLREDTPIKLLDGRTSHPLWNVYRGMKDRCYRATSSGYENYGGRGIRVSPRWLDSFWAFVEDMGDRPDGYTIDRINNDGNYEVTNCIWSSRRAQSVNRRTSSCVSAFGESKTLVEWVEDPRCLISFSGLRYRLSVGWSAERAITEPPGVGGRKKIPNE